MSNFKFDDSRKVFYIQNKQIANNEMDMDIVIQRKTISRNNLCSI